MAFDVTEHPIAVVMGVSGSGKTTIGRLLAQSLGVEFWDADDFHSASSIAKMTRGEALTDADRSGWLSLMRARIDRALAEHRSVVLACSALKERYRGQLGIDGPGVALVYLRTTPELLARRLAARTEHFMPPSLLMSQFADLEEPTDAIVIDADQPAGAIVSQILDALEKR